MIGSLPESLTQGLLVGKLLVGGLGVLSRVREAKKAEAASPEHCYVLLLSLVVVVVVVVVVIWLSLLIIIINIIIIIN